MPASAWSRGWGARVELGDGQERIRQELVRSIRHPSRSWHVAPVMRGYGRSSSTAHRAIHRLASLGVIALQTTLGAHGETRFTFGVRFWRSYPRRVGQLARMTRGGGRSHPPGAPSAGQLELPFSELLERAGFVPWW